MKTSIWYSVDEFLPIQSGYYLSFVGASMGGGEPETGYNYYDKRKNEWRDYESDSSMSHWANVVFWTDADPFDWYDKMGMTKSRKVPEAEKIAWQQVVEAIERYNIVRGLTGNEQR